MNTQLLGNVAESLGSMIIASSVQTVVKAVAEKVLDIDSMDTKTKVAVVIGTWAIGVAASAAVTYEVISEAKTFVTTCKGVIDTIKESKKVVES